MDPADDKAQVTSDNAEWQRRLLPLMTKLLIALAAFFFVASLGQLLYLHVRIQNPPLPGVDAAYEVLTLSATPTNQEKLQEFRDRSLVMLELHALERRYHQANVALMTRVWARYLGFATGMVLCIVGATFVLGRITGPESEVGGKAAGLTYSLKSASPGIVMVGLGVVLMMTTIVTHHRIEMEDMAVFTSGFAATPTASETQQDESGNDLPTLPPPGSVPLQDNEEVD